MNTLYQSIFNESNPQDIISPTKYGTDLFKKKLTHVHYMWDWWTSSASSSDTTNFQPEIPEPEWVGSPKFLYINIDSTYIPIIGYNSQWFFSLRKIDWVNNWEAKIWLVGKDVGFKSYLMDIDLVWEKQTQSWRYIYIYSCTGDNNPWNKFIYQLLQVARKENWFNNSTLTYEQFSKWVTWWAETKEDIMKLFKKTNMLTNFLSSYWKTFFWIFLIYIWVWKSWYTYKNSPVQLFEKDWWQFISSNIRKLKIISPDNGNSHYKFVWDVEKTEEPWFLTHIEKWDTLWQLNDEEEKVRLLEIEKELNILLNNIRSNKDIISSLETSKSDLETSKVFLEKIKNAIWFFQKNKSKKLTAKDIMDNILPAWELLDKKVKNIILKYSEPKNADKDFTNNESKTLIDLIQIWVVQSQLNMTAWTIESNLIDLSLRQEDIYRKIIELNNQISAATTKITQLLEEAELLKDNINGNSENSYIKKAPYSWVHIWGTWKNNSKQAPWKTAVIYPLNCTFTPSDCVYQFKTQVFKIFNWFMERTEEAQQPERTEEAQQPERTEEVQQPETYRSRWYKFDRELIKWTTWEDVRILQNILIERDYLSLDDIEEATGKRETTEDFLNLTIVALKKFYNLELKEKLGWKPYEDKFTLEIWQAILNLKVKQK